MMAPPGGTRPHCNFNREVPQRKDLVNIVTCACASQSAWRRRLQLTEKLPTNSATDGPPQWMQLLALERATPADQGVDM